MSETFVLRWVLKGGISMDRRRHLPGAREYVPFRGFGKAGPVREAGTSFGTLLGPETTGPWGFPPFCGVGVFMVAVCFCLFLRRPEACLWSLPRWGGGCGCGWV